MECISGGLLNTTNWTHLIKQSSAFIIIISKQKLK